MGNRAPLTIHREVAGFSLVFRWWGGEYIDIAFPGGESFEVINVWSAEDGKPTIEETLTGMRGAVNDWINDPEMNRAHDLREYALAAGRIR